MPLRHLVSNFWCKQTLRVLIFSFLFSGFCSLWVSDAAGLDRVCVRGLRSVVVSSSCMAGIAISAPMQTTNLGTSVQCPQPQPWIAVEDNDNCSEIVVTRQKGTLKDGISVSCLNNCLEVTVCLEAFMYLVHWGGSFWSSVLTRAQDNRPPYKICY